MEKNVEISILYQLYGNLLSQKQFEFIDDYYNNDLSLSEIAENHGITRQAVRDVIQKGEKKLFYYEEKSIEEIGEVLKLSPGNVKVKLHRTRKKIYVLMNGKE